MKINYILSLLIAVVVLALAACSDNDEMTLLDELQVSSSYLAIDDNGGTTTITLTAKYDWQIDTESVPSWLTITPMFGTAGTTTISFSADAVDEARTATVLILCNGKTQYINLMQGEGSGVETATIAEVLEGVNNKTYRVTGTVTAIANTEYGNFYMNDGTSDTDLYIYGTVDATGSYNWSSFGIEVGDEVTVEGPRSVYAGVVELVDATCISVTKSLISVNAIDPEDGIIAKEGGTITVALACAGNGVTVAIPDEAAAWLAISGIVSASGSATVTFIAAENTGGDRNTTITFYTTANGTDYTCQATIYQEGSIIPASIAEFNAAAVDDTKYRLAGYVSAIDNATYGTFYLTDYSATTYVYGLDNFQSIGIKEGDIVTIVGKRGEYNGLIEVVNAELEEYIPVTTITVAEFRELPDDNSTYYQLTGMVTPPTEDGTKFDLDDYGNFNLTDATGSVYIYGVTTGVGGYSGQFGTLGVHEGDNITIVGYKTSYYGLIEVGGAMYISHSGANFL